MSIFGTMFNPVGLAKQEQQEARYRAMMAEGQARLYGMFATNLPDSIMYGNSVSTTTVSPQENFTILKKSIKEIEAEPFENDARRRIEDKINRLQSAGAVAQACILEQELRTRSELIRLKEWDYKILTKEVIDKFQANNQMTATRDGIKVHIDALDKYCGNPQVGEAKDRIMPDHILESLETAKARDLFDDFAVLWVEKVKDPLLLGIVEGCKDYFFIAEWGEDVSFEQISKGEKPA